MNDATSRVLAKLSEINPAAVTDAHKAALERNDSSAVAMFNRAAAMAGTQTQTLALEKSGRLYEHVEPPSPANGGRYITRFYGDPMAWMSAFMTDGNVCKLDREVVQKANRDEALRRDVAANGAPVTVRVKPGQRVQIIEDAPAPRTALKGGIVKRLKAAVGNQK